MTSTSGNVFAMSSSLKRFLEFLGPIMVQLFVRSVPLSGFGSHPYRVVSIAYRRPFHCHGKRRKLNNIRRLAKSPAQDSAVYHRLFRVFRSHLRPVKSLKVQFAATLKILRSALGPQTSYATKAECCFFTDLSVQIDYLFINNLRRITPAI